MFESIERKDVVARKPHKCDYCQKQIKQGEMYDYSRFKFDGEFYTWRCHLSCSRIADAIFDYVDPYDGMTSDEFLDGCEDVCQRFICPGCEKWDKDHESCTDDNPYCLDKMDVFFKTHELWEDKSLRTQMYDVWKCREKI